MQHNRKSPRAKRYDYSSPWWYFITICTRNHIQYFGNINDWKMALNKLWEFCYNEISRLSVVRRNIFIDEFIVMPNHVHLLLIMTEFIDCRDTSAMCPINGINWLKKIGLNNNKTVLQTVPTKKYNWPILWSIIKLFKWNVTKFAKQNNILFEWQSRYHDHIIRDNKSYENIKYYIQTNPKNRNKDTFYE